MSHRTGTPEPRNALAMFAVWGSFTLIVIVIIAAILAITPVYRVWSSTKAGEAELRRAEFNRQIAVREAEATRESSILLAQAEVERARGVADANAIIGDSLQDNDMYIRYLWVQGVNHPSNRVIYIPTEGGLPILEATRDLR